MSTTHRRVGTRPPSLGNVAGATTAANEHGGVISAAIWTFVVVLAVVLLVLERRTARTGRPSVLGPRGGRRQDEWAGRR